MGARLRSPSAPRALKGMLGPIHLPCPRCGDLYDARMDFLVVCPICKQQGSTACCNPHGEACICADCERKKS
jgi:hypothetical protein